METQVPQGPQASSAGVPSPEIPDEPCAAVRRLATQRDDGAWWCGCNHRFGVGVTDANNAKSHEDGDKHRRWQIREAKAAEEAAAKEKAPGQKGATLLSFFSKAPVCAPQQSQQQGDDSNDVLCLDDVGSGEGDRDVGGGDCTPLSPSSAGGGLDMSDVAGHDDEQPAADLSSSACPGFEPEIGYPAVQGYPFGMHSKAGIRIPWKLELYGPGLRLRAVEEDGRRGCTGRASPCGGPCERCASLEFYPKVTGHRGGRRPGSRGGEKASGPFLVRVLRAHGRVMWQFLIAHSKKRSNDDGGGGEGRGGSSSAVGDSNTTVVAGAGRSRIVRSPSSAPTGTSSGGSKGGDQRPRQASADMPEARTPAVSRVDQDPTPEDGSFSGRDGPVIKTEVRVFSKVDPAGAAAGAEAAEAAEEGLTPAAEGSSWELDACVDTGVRIPFSLDSGGAGGGVHHGRKRKGERQQGGKARAKT